MVHKKYTHRDGKTYGPYLYENKRVDGKVVTRYVGKSFSGENKISAFNFLVLILVIAGVIGAMYYLLQPVDVSPTGRVSLETKLLYKLGEPLDGTIKFNLKEGELVPADSKVLISLGNQTREYVLSDIVHDELSDGGFYAEDSALLGSGSGYGVKGTKVSYPTIDFQLLVKNKGSSEEKDKEDKNKTEETTSETGETGTETETTSETADTETETGTTSEGTTETTAETGGETTTETTTTETTTESSSSSESLSPGNSEGAGNSESSNAGGNSESSGGSESGNTGGDSGVTGQAIGENEFLVEGSVSKDKDFSYNLEDGQKAEVVDGSVNIEGSAIADNSVSLKEKDGVAVVSTDYFISESGFGQEFLGDYILSLQVDVADFGLVAENDTFVIKLVYGDSEIASQQQSLSVTSAGNGTIVLVNKTENIIPETNVTNVTIVVGNLSLVFIKDLPDVRIAQGGNYTFNLKNYFDGAEGYSLNVENITSEFLGHGLVLNPDLGFKGARKGVVKAYLGNEGVESNEFTILVSSGAVNIQTLKKRIVVGETVKWTKNVSLDAPDSVSVELPGNAENVTVKKVTENGLEDANSVVTGNALTGQVTIDVNLNKQPRILKWWKSLIKAITGRAIEIVDTSNQTGIVEVALQDNATAYIIEYQTPAPQALEDLTGDGKKIVISAPDELQYTDVIAFTNLSNTIPVGGEGGVVLYWHNYEFDKITENRTAEDIPEVEITEDTSAGAGVQSESEDISGVAIIEVRTESATTTVVSNETNDSTTTAENSTGIKVEIVEEETVTAETTNASVTGNSLLVGKAVSDDELNVNNKKNKMAGRVIYSQPQNFLSRAGYLDISKYLNVVVGSLRSARMAEWLMRSPQERLPFARSGGSNPSPGAVSNVYYNGIPSFTGRAISVDLEGTEQAVDNTINDNTDSTNSTQGEIINDNSISEATSVSDSESIVISRSAVSSDLDEKVASGNATEGVDYVKQVIPFDAYDLDGDGFLDYMEWVVPHLSSQTYTISTGYSSITNITFESGFAHLAVNNNTNNAPYDSLWGYWNFDIDDNVTAYDFSSYNRDGTYEGLATTTPSLFSNGANFTDTTGDYIAITGTSQTGILNNSYSLSIWYYPRNDGTSANINQDIFVFGGSVPSATVNGSLLRWISSTNRTLFITNGNAPVTGIDTLGTTVNSQLSNNWYNIVVTYDKATGNKTIWINGVGKASNLLGGTIAHIPLPTGGVVWQISSNTARPVFGIVDEVMVFNTSLTGAQVTNIFNNQSARFVASGDVVFQDYAFGNQSTVNLTLSSCQTNKDSYIAGRIQDGALSNFTDCGIVDYAVIGGEGLSSSNSYNLTTTLFSNSSKFYTPIIGTSLVIKTNVSTGFNITGCPVEISEPGVYRVANNIATIGDCITVNADNVTIDGQGYNVDGGNTGYGVTATGRLNTTVKNVNFTDFQRGVSFEGTNSSLILNNSFYANNIVIPNFVYLGNTQDNQITNNTAWYGASIIVGYGAYIYAGANNTIRGNAFTDISGIETGYGVYLDTTQNNTIIDNNLINIDYGLFVTSSGGNTFSGGEINNSGAFGDSIYISGAPSYNNNFTNMKVNGTKSTYYDIRFETAGVNGTWLIDMLYIGNYTFAGLGQKVNFKNSTFGTVEFLQNINGTGRNLTGSVIIGNNSVNISSLDNLQNGLNKSANITLYSIGNRGISNPDVFKDGAICAECYNFTTLTANTVVFNTSMAGNYSISNDAYSLIACGTLSSAGVYTLQNNIASSGTCLTVTASDVTIDGQGYLINYSQSVAGYGISSSGTIVNLTIRDVVIFQGSTNSSSYGILFGTVSDGAIEDVNITTFGSNSRGISLTSTSPRNEINSPIITTSGVAGYGIAVFSGSGVINSPIITTSAATGIYMSSSANYNQINNATVTTSSAIGIQFLSSSRNNVTNGTFSSTTGNTISISSASTDNIFKNVTLLPTTKFNFDNAEAINGTKFVDMPYIGNYSFTGVGGTIIVENTLHGEVRFISSVNGSGTNLTRDIVIGNNSVNISSVDNLVGLNKSANITLYNIGNRGISSLLILRDGADCAECYNFTALTAETVIFNISTVGNYSIGQDPTQLIACGTLGSAGTTYTLQQAVSTTGTCFTISADNVTLDGAGFNVDGDAGASDYGVTATGRLNTTVKNVNFTDFARGVNFDGTNSSLILNNSAYSFNIANIYMSYLSKTQDNQITNNTARYDPAPGGSGYGTYLSQGFNNTLRGNTFTDIDTVFTGYGVYLLLTQNNTLIDNNFITNDYGAYLTSSSGNTFSGGEINVSNDYAIYIESLTDSGNDNNFTNMKINGNVLLVATAYDLFFNTAGVNGTWLIDMPHIGNYSFPGLGQKVNFKNSTHGTVEFLENINGTGRNLTGSVVIGNNSVNISSLDNAQNGLNKSANITLYSIGNRGISNPDVFKDGAICAECYNFTALTANTVIFNVSMAGNYSITSVPDTTIPLVSFVGDTPADASTQTYNSLVVNVSSSDSNDHYAFVDFDRDLVGWWRFDDVNSSGDPVDISTWGNNGSLKGNAKINSTGRFGNASWYDGDNDKITIPYSQIFNYSNYDEVTFSFWMFLIEYNGADQKMFSQYNSGSDSPFEFMWDDSTNEIEFQAFNDSGVNAPAVYVHTPSVWTHVVGTINSSTTSLYVDGVLRKNASRFGRLNGKGSQSLTIGARPASTFDFNGSIDEVMVFNRSLSTSEISSLYNATATQYYNNFTGLSSGVHNFTAYAVDLAGNKNQTEQRGVTLNLDSTGPAVTINFPGAGITYGLNHLPLNFNVTLSETGSVLYSLDNGVNNVTMKSSADQTSLTGTIFNSTNASIADGTYTFRVYANDSLDNRNFTHSAAFTFDINRLSDCVTIGENNTVFTLNNSISTTGTCFTISADNVTLDGAGFNVDGDDGASDYGISATGRLNLTVKNLNITDFGQGVYIFATNDSLFENNTIHSSTYGIYTNAVLSDNNIIRGNTITLSGLGIYMYSSRYFVVANNTLDGGDGGLDYGIIAGFNSYYNNVTNNTIKNMGSSLTRYGLFVYTSSQNNTFVDNKAESVSYGLYLSTFDNDFYNNSFDSNSINGIYITTVAISNEFAGGRINASGQDAIFIEETSRDNNFTNINITNTSVAYRDIKWATASINRTWLIDMPHIGNYSFTGVGGLINVKNSTYGVIEFTSAVNGSGTNLTRSVVIGNNSVNISSLDNAQNGLNKSANITLYGIGDRSISSIGILRDGASCGGACYNFTALTANTVIFNISTAGNYTIGVTDNVVPTITFGLLTENDLEFTDANSIYINVSITEANENSVMFSLRNSSGAVNRSILGSGNRTFNFTGLSAGLTSLPAGMYVYNVTVNDTAGNLNVTGNINITILDSCLALASPTSCAEDGGCTITNNCVLYNSLCSNSVCDFTNFTLGAQVRTLYNASGDGRALHINVTNTGVASAFLFNITGLNTTAKVIASGKNGTTWGSGSIGGVGGTLNFTTRRLFNTTSAIVITQGGYSSISGTAGGKGGQIQFNYKGIIRNFNLGGATINVSGGTSSESGKGMDGNVTYNKELGSPFGGLRDADVSGDGTVAAADVTQIRNGYNNITSDVDFVSDRDITIDNRISVADIARVGFEINTRIWNVFRKFISSLTLIF